MLYMVYQGVFCRWLSKTGNHIDERPVFDIYRKVEENGYMELLENTDILIDGKFVLAERSIDLIFKGSRNQRIIDVKKSLEEGKAVRHEIDEQNL